MSSSTEKEKEINGVLPEWVNRLSNGAARDNWPPKAKDHEIDWHIPTHEVYHDPSFVEFTPEFQDARKKLDYSYHRNPARSRQELQDLILARVVRAAKNANQSDNQSDNTPPTEVEEDQEEKQPPKVEDTNNNSSLPGRPWIVFSAGPMGVGKGYVMSTLNERGLFPLDRFLTVDPDFLKSELPEMSGYLQQDPDSAATKVHRESTQMADILLEHALELRIPTLVDGSLRDVDYYRSFMERIRTDFPEYQLAILHVTASPEIIRSRAQSRAVKTGRAVPEELLEGSIAQVPKSVAALSPYVDITITISNEEDQPITIVEAQSKGKLINDSVKEASNNSMSWKEFRDTWWTTLVEATESCDAKKVCQSLPAWCESQCPGVSEMATCWKQKACIQSVKAAFIEAYPSMCPSCTLGDAGPCGICIHDRHMCHCEKCGPLSCH